MHDDFSDHRICRYSVGILVVLAVGLSLSNVFLDPISCLLPADFAGSHEKHANISCRLPNTYYLPRNDEIPRPHEERQTIPYYRWVPFILLGQALFFYLPTLIWHSFNSKAGIDADDILDTAHKLRKAEEEGRGRMLTLITKQMDRFLSTRAKDWQFEYDLKRIPSVIFYRCWGRRVDNYLVMLFLFSKACFITNAIGQLLATQYKLHGFDILKYMVADHDWTEAHTVAFPPVIMCDFIVRSRGINQRYTLQCVLSADLYHEMIYIFLWFWLVTVVVSSVSSFVLLARALQSNDRLQFIENWLWQNKRVDRKDQSVREFIDNYLRQDGAFLLRLIAHNSDSITTRDVVCSLWDKWKNKRPADKFD